MKHLPYSLIGESDCFHCKVVPASSKLLNKRTPMSFTYFQTNIVTWQWGSGMKMDLKNTSTLQPIRYTPQY